MKLQFNEKRAVQFFTILHDLWDPKAGVFEGIVLPQDRWPIPENPVEAANYFAYAAITQRGGVVSEDPFKWVNHLRATEPTLFNPHDVAEHWSVPRIMEVIKEAVTDRKTWEPSSSQEQGLLFEDLSVPQQQPSGKNEKLYKLDEFAASWLHNSVTLSRRWNGSALEIFKGVTGFEAAFARIDYKNPVNKDKLTFTGIRRKIFALFTIWLQEKGLVPIFPTPIPVDFHALRLLFATGVAFVPRLKPFVRNPSIHPADFEGRPMIRTTEKLTDKVALWSLTFLSAHGFSHLAINPALWVLSRELCPHELQTKSKGRGRGTKGRRGIQLLYDDVLRADPSRWPVPYADPAQACPVALLCKLAIPSGPYYSFGLLALLERVPYPHPTLFPVDPFAFTARRKNDRK